MWKDLLHGLRALRRSPVFTLAAVASLALGIGANTAIFSLLNQVVLRSLPVADPERLATVHGQYFGPGDSSSSSATNSESVFAYPLYRDFRDRPSKLSEVLACAAAETRLTWQGNTQMARTELVSGNYFPLLGVPAALGRTIAPSDAGAPGENPVAVLSHAFWQSRLGGDAAVLNRNVAINGQPFAIIGVAAEGFNGLVQGDAPDVYAPATMERAIMPASPSLELRTFSWLNLFIRLKPGAAMAQAQAELNVAFHAVVENDLRVKPPHDSKEREERLRSTLELRPAARGISELKDQWEKPLTVLMIMVGLVLLIACANVAGLLVARATGRQREIAIRLALGANRRALVQGLLAEGLLLAMAGTAAGLAMEHFATRALLRLLPEEAGGSWLTSSLDLPVLGYSLALSVLCAVLFALVPALQTRRTDLAAAIRNHAAGAALQGSPARMRRILVTGQVALSLVLVVGAGLFSASAANLIHAKRGFRTERLALFPVDVTLIRSGEEPAVEFYRNLLARLSALPGQAGVAAADGGPYSGAGFNGSIRVEGRPADEQSGASMKAVSPGYFAALGIPLRAGREFNERDTPAAPKAVVVDDAFVKKYFANQSPIGRRLSLSGGKAAVLDREIVGVAADVRTDVRGEFQPTIYLPYTQRKDPARLTFYVRVTGDDSRMAAAIRGIVHEADAGLPVPEIKQVDLTIRESLYASRLIAALSAAFGVLATILAAVGIYGVIGFAVARRTGEIGLRMALGALPSDVLRLVLRDAGGMTAIGIGVGLAAAFGLSRYAESQLFGIQAADPAIYVGAAAVLAAVAVLAAFIPAWRAARIDPVSALRQS